jgi:hypothetical protein
MPKPPLKYEDAESAFTIPVFCRRNSISLSTYRKLVLAGTGPRTIHAGPVKILISAGAERDWIKAREVAPTRSEQLIRKAAAELRVAKARFAGARSAASRKRISKQRALAADRTARARNAADGRSRP